MSGTGKGPRQQPKGDIPPAHFVASALQLGIFPKSVQVPEQKGAGTNGTSGKSSLSALSVGFNASTLDPIKCTDGACGKWSGCDGSWATCA